jgi:hypothetical protein
MKNSTPTVSETQQNLDLERRDTRVDQRQLDQQQHQLGPDLDALAVLDQEHQHVVRDHDHPGQEQKQQRQPRVDRHRGGEDLRERTRTLEVEFGVYVAHGAKRGRLRVGRAVPLDRPSATPLDDIAMLTV